MIVSGDILFTIFSYFCSENIFGLFEVCKYWHFLLSLPGSNSFWKHLYSREYNLFFSPTLAVSFKTKCFARLILRGALQNKSHLTKILTHGREVWDLALQDSKLASASGDFTAKIWSLSDFSEQYNFEHDNMVGVVLFFRDSLLLTGDDNCNVNIWSLKEKNRTKLKMHQHFIWDLIVCNEYSSQPSIVSSAQDKNLILWDLLSGKYIHTFYGHQGTVYSVHSLCDNLVASGSTDTLLKIWDTHNKECIISLRSHTKPIVTVRSDDTKMYSASEDKTIKIWDKRKISDSSVLTINHTDIISSLHVEQNNFILADIRGDILFYDIKKDIVPIHLSEHPGAKVRALVSNDHFFGSADNEGKILIRKTRKGMKNKSQTISFS